MHYDKLFRLDL